MTADGLSDYTLPFRESLSRLLSLLECPKSDDMFDLEKHDGYLTPLKKKSFDWGHIGNPYEYDTPYFSLSLSLPVPIAVSWHCGYSKMDFPIHHDICGKFFPGCPENHLQKTANERRHVDVSREPCLGDLSTTALEAVKATKCSWIAWPTDKLTDCQCLKQRCDESYADVWGYLETAMQHVHCFSVGASSGSC